MARLFGTDGIRGLACGDVLTAELALRLARSRDPRPAAARAVRHRSRHPSVRPDARGGCGRRLRRGGPHVELLGVVPTPAVAYVVASGAADLGLVISASHNPAPDNGLKLFGPAATSSRTRRRTPSRPACRPGSPARPGGPRPPRHRPAVEGYLEHLLASADAWTG